MTPEEKRRGAFEELNELLGEGMTVTEAIRIAAENNGLKPEIFRAFAEEHLDLDLDGYRARMMRRADHDRVVAIATQEIAKCERREVPYKSLGLFQIGAEEVIAECVGAALGRPLDEGEMWTIEDMWDERFYANLPDLKTSIKRSREWKRAHARNDPPDVT